MDKIHLKRNAPVAQLYEDAVKFEGAVISASGALINFSGKKTGRSPKDKRIVQEETSKDDIWVSFNFSRGELHPDSGRQKADPRLASSGDLSTSPWTSTLSRSTVSVPSTS